MLCEGCEQQEGAGEFVLLEEANLHSSGGGVPSENRTVMLRVGQMALCTECHLRFVGMHGCTSWAVPRNMWADWRSLVETY